MRGTVVFWARCTLNGMAESKARVDRLTRDQAEVAADQVEAAALQTNTRDRTQSRRITRGCQWALEPQTAGVRVDRVHRIVMNGWRASPVILPTHSLVVETPAAGVAVALIRRTSPTTERVTVENGSDTSGNQSRLER